MVCQAAAARVFHFIEQKSLFECHIASNRLFVANTTNWIPIDGDFACFVYVGWWALLKNKFWNGSSSFAWQVITMRSLDKLGSRDKLFWLRTRDRLSGWGGVASGSLQGFARFVCKFLSIYTILSIWSKRVSACAIHSLTRETSSLGAITVFLHHISVLRKSFFALFNEKFSPFDCLKV